MNQLERVPYTPQLTPRFVSKATLPALLPAAWTVRCPHTSRATWISTRTELSGVPIRPRTGRESY